MNTENRQQTVAIVGLGLIGASLALALKGKYRVLGCSRSKSTEEYAVAHGMVDEIRAVRDLRGVDCVIVCTPLAMLRESVQEVYRAVGDSAVITDVGSVKGLLRGLSGRIVGGHPMAGTEHSGIRAAKERLFENAYYCVVPYENTLPEDTAFVVKLAESIGAKPLMLSAEEHDRAVANFSHMPHLAAYALSEYAVDSAPGVAGSGFLDSTRIAGSDPAFWTEVFRLNRENVLCAADGYLRQLQTMRDLLAEERYDELLAVLVSAQEKRKKLR